MKTKKKLDEYTLSTLVISVLSYFFTLAHKRHDFRENVTVHKTCVLIPPQLLF